MQEAGQQLFADTVQEELMLCDKTLTEEEIDSVLGKMNLSHAKTMHPGALSGGEKQRLALATALCTDRKIRFYDEPTSGQDMENLAKTVETIRSLAERAEVSFVVTHDLECISQCATHILYLNNGRVEAFLEYKHAENTRIWKWLKERNKTMKKQNGIGRLLEFTGKYRGLLSFSQVLSAISAVFILIPFVCVYFAAKELVEKADRANVEAKRIAYDGVQEFLENIQEIKSNSREEEYLGKLNEKLESVVNYSFRNELAPGIAVSISQFVLRFGLVIVLLVGSILVTKGTLSIPMLLLFLLFAGRIYDPFSSCFMLLAEVFSALVSIKRMKEMEETKEQTGILECNPESYDIMFEDVRFSYNEEEVLKGISFTAKQGEVTALVGPSGSGKSTVSKLAARFWDATSGKVSIGGIDVASVEPEVLLEKFAIVFQDVILFDNTIMENIRLGRKDATDEEVIIAAKAAQCQEFIDRMPNGYQTNIGENGCNLSGGERQRISIARALLKNAPIVLLDEATASMDAESETLVQKALGKLLKNKTVLVIAHRMRTIAKANKVVVLEDGLVKEEGTPEELLDKQGLFYQLVNMQK